MARVKVVALALIVLGALLIAASDRAYSQISTPSSKPPVAQNDKPTPENHESIDKGHPPKPIPSPFQAELVEALRAIASQQKAARDQDQSNERRWWPPSPSWAIVYVTVVYVLIALFQLRAIDRQADIAEEIPVIIEAPYLSVQMMPHILQQGGIPEPEPWIEYWFKNNGRTQAQVTDLCVHFDMGGTSALPVKPTYRSFRVRLFAYFVIPPNAESTHARCNAGFSFHSPADFLPVQDHRFTCTFYGYVRYRSIFARRPPHILGFGYAYDPAWNAFVPMNAEYNYDREDRNDQKS